MSGAQNYTSTQISNQGIVDGHPAGQQPSPQPVTLDTIADHNTTGKSGSTQGLPGVTSKDMYQSMGQPGRKKESLGLEA
ncbi:hypothetical protein EDD18DRAFT_1206623, partial [Armillaria luteobubalina]